MKDDFPYQPIRHVSLFEAQALKDLEGSMTEEWKHYLVETRCVVHLHAPGWGRLPYRTTMN